jgi:hypothetical protein
MQYKRNKEQKRRERGKRPYQHAAPIFVCRAEIAHDGEYDQNGNYEPAVVQAYLNAKDTPEFNVSSHFTHHDPGYVALEHPNSISDQNCLL